MTSSLENFMANTLYAAEQKVFGDFLNSPPNSVPLIKLQMKNYVNFLGPCVLSSDETEMNI